MYNIIECTNIFMLFWYVSINQDILKPMSRKIDGNDLDSRDKSINNFKNNSARYFTQISYKKSKWITIRKIIAFKKTKNLLSSELCKI